MRYLPFLLLVGCMQPSSLPAPSPRQRPVSVGDVSLAVEADASTISTLFKYAGASNEISLRSDLDLKFGDTGLHLPAGTSFAYELTELGGTVTFGHPKPVVSTKVLGATVHPTLDKIVLRQPNLAVAYATDFLGVQHTSTINLPDIGQPAVELAVPEPAEKKVPAPEDLPEPLQKPVPGSPVPPPDKSVKPGMSERDLPIVFLWTLRYENPDRTDAVSQAVINDCYNNGTFHLVVDPKEHKPFSKQRPCLQYSNGSRTHHQLGWSGLKSFLEALQSPPATEERTQEPPKAVTNSSPVGIITAPGWHSHRCLSCGYTWSHNELAKGNPALHTCPHCHLLQWDKL